MQKIVQCEIKALNLSHNRVAIYKETLMSKLKKIVLLLTLAVMASGSFSNDLAAQDYTTDVGGCGYQDSYSSPSLTPYIALGTVVIIAIVVLAVRHHHHHNNNHSHCH